MKRPVAVSSAAVLASVCVALPAAAETFEEAVKLQKNGMWEIRVGAQAEPMLFCVTDSTRMDGIKQSRESAKQMGCKLEKESFKDGKYEVAFACASPSPEVGAFRVVMKGTARADHQSGMTTVTGGGKLMQAMFPSGQQTAVESRWVRPCKPGEKPGPQGNPAPMAPAGAYPGMEGTPRLGIPPVQPVQGMDAPGEE